MSDQRRISKFMFGDHKTPLPSPYLVYFLALVCGMFAILYGAQILQISTEKERVRTESLDLDLKLQMNSELISNFDATTRALDATKVDLKKQQDDLDRTLKALRRAKNDEETTRGGKAELESQQRILRQENVSKVKESKDLKDEIDREIRQGKLAKKGREEAEKAQQRAEANMIVSQRELSELKDEIDLLEGTHRDLVGKSSGSFSALVSELEGRQAEIAKIATELGKIPEEMNTAVEGIEQRERALDQSLDTLKLSSDRLNDVTEENFIPGIERLKTQADTFEDEIDRLTRTVSDLEALSTESSSLSTTVEGVDSLVSKLSNMVDEAQSEIKTLQDNLRLHYEKQEQELQQSYERITEAERSSLVKGTTGLEDANAALEDTLKQLKADFISDTSDIQLELSVIEKTLAELSKELSGMRQKAVTPSEVLAPIGTSPTIPKPISETEDINKEIRGLN